MATVGGDGRGVVEGEGGGGKGKDLADDERCAMTKCTDFPFRMLYGSLEGAESASHSKNVMKGKEGITWFEGFD